MSLPLKNQAYEFYLGLGDILNPDEFVANPTIAAGDFQISIDGSVFVNLDTLPIVEPAGSIMVKVSLSASEMNGEKVNVKADDASGNEWQPAIISIDVPEGNVETLTDLELGDRIETNNRLVVNKAGTLTTILDKEITGSLLTPNVTLRTTDT